VGLKFQSAVSCIIHFETKGRVTADLIAGLDVQVFVDQQKPIVLDLKLSDFHENIYRTPKLSTALGDGHISFQVLVRRNDGAADMSVRLSAGAVCLKTPHDGPCANSFFLSMSKVRTQLQILQNLCRAVSCRCTSGSLLSAAAAITRAARSP
jgi:hypothetical protein